MKGLDVLNNALTAQGIKRIIALFGRELREYIPPKNIDIITVRHEQTGAIMAEVTGRIENLPGVFMCTMGPGATNAATGVASAFADRSPMVCIVFQVETDKQRPTTHQYLDIGAFFRPISKEVLEPKNISELSSMLKRAFKAAAEEVPGSIVIILPINLLSEDEKNLPVPNEDSSPEPLHEPDDLSYLELIEKSKSPIILAGGGTVRQKLAGDIANLAEKTNIPVATTLGAKGILPENSPLSLGCVSRYLDCFVRPDLTSYIFDRTDLIILAGYDEAEDITPELWGNNIRTLLIDSGNCGLKGELEPTCMACGDPKKILKRISEKLSKRDDHPALEIVQNARKENCAPLPHPDKDIDIWSIREFIAALNDSVHPDSYICVDVGMDKHATGILFEAQSPYRNIYSNGLATMGFGLPAGMGAALAYPERKTIVICGDGGFHSVSQDLETCARYNLNIVVFVLVNNGYGLIKYYQKLGNSPIIDAGITGFGYVDFAALAHANGCRGVKLQTLSQLKKLLADTDKNRTPVVVEVPVDYGI